MDFEGIEQENTVFKSNKSQYFYPFLLKVSLKKNLKPSPSLCAQHGKNTSVLFSAQLDGPSKTSLCKTRKLTKGRITHVHHLQIITSSEIRCDKVYQRSCHNKPVLGNTQFLPPHIVRDGQTGNQSSAARAAGF